AKVGMYKGVLDCGLPYYGYGGIHIEQSNEVKIGDFVEFLGIKIGVVINKINDFAIFKAIPLNIEVNNKTFKGISFYLYLDKFADVKLVPTELDSFNFKVGNSLKVKITSLSF
ncbi:MAG: hypothetical protein QW589_05810, partial [Candidatus Bathyarchaeia archaeon]